MPIETKKLTKPFAIDREGNVVYSPGGLYSASYFVPDSNARERIKRNLSTASSVVGILPILMRWLDIACEKQPWGSKESAWSTAATLICGIWYFRLCGLQSEGLAVARQQPSIRKRLQIAADNVPSLHLWCCQLGAILFALLMAWVAQHPYRKPDIGGYMTLTLLVLASCAIACVCSYVLLLKQRPAANSQTQV